MKMVRTILPLFAFTQAANSFTVIPPVATRYNNNNNIHHGESVARFMADNADPNSEGSSLAAAFAVFAKESGVQLSEDDWMDDDDDDDEDDDDDDEGNLEISSDIHDSETDRDDDAVTLTSDQIYREVKERVLDTAGGFVDFVQEASEDDDNDNDDERTVNVPKVYQPPVTIPDAELTAGEVVEIVLDALRHLDNPTPYFGMEVLFGYSSDSSQVKQDTDLTPAEFTDYWKDSEYKVLFANEGAVITKGDYSFDGKKAFYTALLKVGSKVQDVVSVNFILSNHGDEADSWLVDSLLIRPESMRRRRRK